MEEECRELAEKCFAYIDGELSGAELEAVLARMEEYECCRRCIDTLRETRDSLGHLKKDDIPKNMKERLKARLREKCQIRE
jgi:anti-sigma factor RsiW